MLRKLSKATLIGWPILVGIALALAVYFVGLASVVAVLPVAAPWLLVPVAVAVLLRLFFWAKDKMNSKPAGAGPQSLPGVAFYNNVVRVDSNDRRGP